MGESADPVLQESVLGGRPVVFRAGGVPPSQAAMLVEKELEVVVDEKMEGWDDER
jgi:hypothetical protein